MSSIRLTNVRKIYPVPGAAPVRAVDGITLEVSTGDRLGIIGPNGAGKSTLLQMIAGLTAPTDGEITVAGHVTAVMTLGIGLRDHATGRENVYLDGQLQGQSRSDVDRIIEAVIAFSELGDFIDQPVRTYSTGMKARLAFAMLCHLDPDILVIDEALSVGDAAFARKAAGKIREICARGRIVIIVSHSMSAVREICNRCLWLSAGRIVMDGAPADVTDRYIESVRSEDQRQAVARFNQLAGARSVREGWHIEVALHQHDGADRRVLESGMPLRIRLAGTAPGARDYSIALEIIRLDGMRMFAEDFAGREFAAGDGAFSMNVDMTPLVLGPGTYRIGAAVHGDAGLAADRSVVFEVYAPIPPTGGKPMLIYPVEYEVIKVGAC
jgi:lipopolysaccharide transport system ATP-binding protein